MVKITYSKSKNSANLNGMSAMAAMPTWSTNTTRMAIVTLKENVGYRVHSNGTIGEWQSSTDKSVVSLASDEYLEQVQEWIHSSPQAHQPLWENLVSIRIGEHVCSPDKWNHADAWKKQSKEQSFFDLEHHDYILFLNMEMTE